MLTQESAARKDRTTGASAELQHRHFAFIAATIANLPDEPQETADTLRGEIALFFADACKHTNPRFDRARFLKACGVES